MKYLKDIAFLFLIVALCSCASPEDKNQGISDPIVVTYITGPEIEMTDLLDFWVKNTSDECIVFPFDFGAKILLDNNGSWIEINNLARYHPEEDIYLRAAGNIFSENAVGLQPDYSSIVLQENTDLLVVITGHLCEDDSVIIEKQIPFVVKP